MESLWPKISDESDDIKMFDVSFKYFDQILPQTVVTFSRVFLDLKSGKPIFFLFQDFDLNSKLKPLNHPTSGKILPKVPNKQFKISPRVQDSGTYPPTFLVKDLKK